MHNNENADLLKFVCGEGDLDSPEAQENLYRLALALLDPQTEPGKQRLGAEFMGFAVERGHVNAMYALGLCYRWGDGGV